MARPRSSAPYPVGARWFAQAENGATAELYLKERSVIEVWIWKVTHKGGSFDPVRDTGWEPSKRGAVECTRWALSQKTKQRPLPLLRRVEECS